jgi:hypothetical protein
MTFTEPKGLLLCSQESWYIWKIFFVDVHELEILVCSDHIHEENKLLIARYFKFQVVL